MASLTVIDLLVDQVLTALTSLTLPTGALVGEEIDMHRLHEAVPCAISVSWIGSAPVNAVLLTGQPIDLTTSIRIECWARNDRRTGGESRPSRLLALRAFQALWADAGLRDAGIDLQLPAFDASTDMTSVSRMGAVVANYEITHRIPLAGMVVTQ